MSSTFASLGVSTDLVRVLAGRNVTSPFAIQKLALPDALAGLDILAESPTGSGKTLAFGLPLVERTAGANRRPAALVLAPTRELAIQIADELSPLARAKGLRVATVYGGVPLAAQAERARSADIVIGTPGRLQDLLDRRLIRLEHVRILVLDEADRMLDMGFRPQVDRILERVPANRQTMLFSATLGGAVAELARAYTSNASQVRAEELPQQSVRPDVLHTFVPVSAEDKLDRLVEQLDGADRLALVFVRTKHGADRLARKLGRQNVRAVTLHGNMSQNQCTRALEQFSSGRVSTLVATDVAARGLDVDDISHVINFDPPALDDDYVHRVGRTGRAGRTGTGVTFVLPDQQEDVGRLARRLGHGAAFSAAGFVEQPRAAQSPSRPGRRRAKRRATR